MDNMDDGESEAAFVDDKECTSLSMVLLLLPVLHPLSLSFLPACVCVCVPHGDALM